MPDRIRYLFRWVTVLLVAVAGTGNIAAASDTGMIPVDMGGGSVVDATFQGGAAEKVTFSFFAALDKDGNPDGSFHVRRGFPDGKVSIDLSTGITSIEPVIVDEENGCAVMSMTGIAKLIPG